MEDNEQVFIIRKSIPAEIVWEYTIKAKSEEAAIEEVMSGELEADEGSNRVVWNPNASPMDYMYDVEEINPN